MATIHQPLLDSQKSTIYTYKLLYIVLIALFGVIFSVFFFIPELTTTSHSTLTIPPYICNKAIDPNTCLEMVAEVASDEVHESNGASLLRKSLLRYIKRMENAVEVINLVRKQINEHNEQVGLADCLELIDLSIDRVTDSNIVLAEGTITSHDDAQAWLDSVLTNHITCLDGLHVQGRLLVENVLEDLISRAKASLAIFAAVSVPNQERHRPIKGNLPSWVTLADQRLLKSVSKDIKADVVVAKDGSGNYSMLSEALASAPNKTKNRYVIYVKRGTYKENVEVAKKKKNLMIVGDGMYLTVITASLNYVDGTSTFKSATLTAVGDGIILQDICIQNTAGPEKHQAVALRVSADQAVINRCLIDAYQDTLYTHSLRQFYRDCNITGTIDFIFGNAAVVLQNCNIISRKPMSNQKNMMTAQGRQDINQETGISIQNCGIIASSDLVPVQDLFKSYLGRPWKNFSRTVVMQSYIGDHVDPAGWSEWNGGFALDTLYYGEYMNRGPGAGTRDRVEWPGFHVITNASDAMNFTVRELIQGDVWLKSSGVAFTEGLSI